MAIPVSAQNAREGYELFRRQAREMWIRCRQFDDQIAADGSVDSAFVLNDLLVCSLETRDAFNEVRTVPGIVAWARNEAGDQAWNVVAAFTDALTKLDAITAAIVAEYPKDASGYLLDRTLNAQARIVWDKIPAGSLTQTVAAIAAFRATLT
jgi:hypothetical protein